MCTGTETLAELRRAAADAGVSTHFVAIDGPDISLADEMAAAAAPEPRNANDWAGVLSRSGAPRRRPNRCWTRMPGC